MQKGVEQTFISGEQLWQWRHSAKIAAISAGVTPLEVDWLLQELAGLDRLTLRLESFKTWPQITLQRPFLEIVQLWQQRLQQQMPVQYLTGVTHWRHFSVAVSPAVLIPRPETEILIDLAVAAVGKTPIDNNAINNAINNTILDCIPSFTPHLDGGHWVDLGTGSGIIALGLAEALTDASIHAVDCSAAALEIAQQNARKLGWVNRIQFYQGSWWMPLEFLKGQVSGMISNPPYIPSAMIPTLQPEVAKHEPHLALDGGTDGLDCIRHLVEAAPTYLQPGGIWLVETMAGQGEAVAKLLYHQGSYCQIQIFPDLAGIQRFVLAYRCE